MWVIFVVACIPTIRPFFVKVFHIVSSSAGRSHATGYIQQSDTNTGLNATRSRVFASTTNTSKGNNSSSNDSEENILGANQRGIMMTNHVSVKYDQADSTKKDWSQTHFEEV